MTHLPVRALNLRLRPLARLAMIGLPLLGGCSWIGLGGGPDKSCHEPQAYETAQEAPSLQVPAGMDAPSDRAAIKVPPLDKPERKRAGSEPCLDEPPTFYPGRPRPGVAKTGG